jgi:hypothetical protein
VNRKGYSVDMSTERIIETILQTKKLENTTIGLAAYLARAGHADCTRDVQEWWKRQGGTVSDAGAAK